MTIRDNKGWLADNKGQLAAGPGPWSLGPSPGLSWARSPRGRARLLTVPYGSLTVPYGSLSVSIRAMQLKLLGQVLTKPDKVFLKEVTFQDGDVLTPTTAAVVRKVGRPKDNWVEKLIALVRPATGTLQRSLEVTSSEQLWNETVADLLQH